MKKKNNSKKFFRWALSLSLVLILSSLGADLQAKEKKDYIVVLDTSLSMVGFGGKNIMPQVKDSLSKFIDRIEVGDSLTFMTFETTVKTYPLVTILNDHDKDIIKKYISMVEARGKWTYTMEMMKNVFLKAEELESKDKKRQRVIVIMTDGIDDPPPEGRRERLSIRDVTKEHMGKDWFIYFVNLADLKNNKKLLAVQRYLKEHVAKHTRIIDADKNIKQGIEKDIHADVDKTMAGKGSFFTSPYFIAGIIILALLIILFFIKRFLDLKVHGKLDYWNHTILDPYTEHYNLTRHNTRMVRIGKSGSVVNIRDLEVHEPFTLLAVREQGQIKCQIKPGSNYTIAIDGKEGQSLLEDGDTFKVSNYTFKYIAD